MKQREKQEQFIIVYVHNLDDISISRDYAVFFSHMLNKGIILLHISDPKYTDVSTTDAETKLKFLTKLFPKDRTVSYAALKGRTKKILSLLPNMFGAVLIITETQSKNNKTRSCSPKLLLRNLYTSRIAYLTIQSPMQQEGKPFEKILLTLDSLRESKEKVLWATYFGRFHQAKTLLVTEQANDSYLKQQIEYNVAFTLKIYRNFNLSLERLSLSKQKGNIDIPAPSIAKQHQAGLVICQTTKNRNIIHRLFGSSEEKVIVNTEHIPILFLNPRTDLYVLCE